MMAIKPLWVKDEFGDLVNLATADVIGSRHEKAEAEDSEDSGYVIYAVHAGRSANLTRAKNEAGAEAMIKRIRELLVQCAGAAVIDLVEGPQLSFLGIDD